jgi:hypothetical protein
MESESSILAATWMVCMNVKLKCLNTAKKQNHKNTQVVINAFYVVTAAHFVVWRAASGKILLSFTKEFTELW